MEKWEALEGSIFQTPDTSGEGEPSPLGETPQEIHPRSRFRFSSILLGLLPLLLLASACLLVYYEGRCRPHAVSGSLALFSLVLWGMEVGVGLLCLFHRQIRSLATTLLLTLILSVLPGCLVVFLSFLTTFCIHMVL